MQDLSLKTIKEIAVENPATARVFEEFKIDYCCGGGKKFDDACISAGVAPEVVEQRLNDLLKTEASDLSTEEKLKASELIDHILDKHHFFTKAEI